MNAFCVAIIFNIEDQLLYMCGDFDCQWSPPFTVYAVISERRDNEVIQACFFLKCSMEWGTNAFYDF